MASPTTPTAVHLRHGRYLTTVPPLPSQSRGSGNSDQSVIANRAANR